jgi:hypothetical protein
MSVTITPAHYMRGCVQDACGSESGQASGSCEHSNEMSDSIKGGESLEQLSDYELLKKDPAPRTGFTWPRIGSSPVTGFCEQVINLQIPQKQGFS